MAENKPLYVLDACVLLKWVFDYEEDSKVALRFLDLILNERIDVAVPVNCFIEISNILAGKKYKDGLEFLSKMLYLGIDQYDFTLKLASGAWEIVEQYEGIVFYDALYHALALKLGGTFVTADERYYERAKALKHILLLKDYR